MLLQTCALVSAQTKTVTFKPGSGAGEDVKLLTSYGCTPTSAPAPWETLNNGGSEQIDYDTWTVSSVGCTDATSRSLIRFTAMDTIPAAATIISATLNLFGPPSSTSAWGSSYFSGSPYPLTNEGWVQRVTGTWSELTVTWNTQPTVTTTNRVAIPVSASRWNHNASLDVTQLVKDIRTAGTNNGFLLRLQTEGYYRSMVFASSDHSNSALWPELIITYSMPVSVSELDMRNVRIYPNPASNIIYVDGMETGSTCTIYNLVGQALLTSQLQGNDLIDISGLPAGSYLAEVANEKGQKGIVRFIKE